HRDVPRQSLLHHAVYAGPIPAHGLHVTEDEDHPLTEGFHERTYNELIFDKNSPFARVLLSLSMSSSMASTGDSGFSTLRSTQIRCRSSFGISSSSFRVPE